MLHEISLLVSENIAEELGDRLMENGALSVALEDADADSENEKPLYGEPGLEPGVCAWKRSRLKALVDENTDPAQLVAKSFVSFGEDVPAIETDTVVPDTDWVKLTQSQFGPTKVSDRLWIVPSWNTPPDPKAINIRLDPGIAFGTGTHPTTHMCLQWLDKNCKPGFSVLDYGCGTGILAIAAAKLGAAKTVGTDIDPQAIEAAQANAETNAVATSFALPDTLGDDRFDIVIANILANPLMVLAPALLGRVAPKGHLVLSGILSHQAESIVRLYHQIDPCVKLSVWKQQEDWVCLSACRVNSERRE